MITAIAIEDEPSALTQLKDCLSAVPDIELNACFSNIADALTYLRANGKVDLIFCDIELPGFTGLMGAKWLKKYTQELVFVTGHGEHALEAFRAFVRYFIVKPVTVTDLQELLEEVLGNDPEKHPVRLKFGKMLLYDGGTKTHTPTLPHNVIKLIQDGNYLSVYIRDQPKPVVVRYTVSLAAVILEPLGLFLQINRRTIVNMDFVTGFEPDLVYLGAEESYSVHEAYKEAYQRFLHQYQFGRGNGLQ